MDELYLCMNTDLLPQDLYRSVWSEIFENWFSVSSIASAKGDLLLGDLADDTKLDGRGRIALPGETQGSNTSSLKTNSSAASLFESSLEHIETVSQDKKQYPIEISCIGSPPSHFRVFIDEQWRPRLAPSFYFKPGKSSLELSLFDSSWQDQDLNELVSKMESLMTVVGSRRLTQIEFECSGQFLAEEESWRAIFATLPIGKAPLS